DDFKERYKKENHPYPSLLDPKKLNDKNEKINYKNIPAELAWEMNLPLPRNYRFIFITGGSCGHMAMFLYFKLLKINRNWTSETEKEKYKIAYNVFIASKEYNIFSCQWIQMTRKLFYLADAEVPLIVLLRDPIERLKSSTNHIVKHSTQFDLTLNPNEVLANKYYKMKDYPSLEKVD
ncbi:sugar transferase, partial [Campylobacter coli]